MISKTKYKTSDQEIAALFHAAGIEDIAEILPLGAGEYNAVFAVKASGKDYAIKIAPSADAPILRYENNLMETEVFWYQQIQKHTDIRIPKIYAADFSKEHIPAHYFIMEKLSGQPLNTMKLTMEERQNANAHLAQMAAQIHKIHNDRFGYIQNALYEDWYQALRAMVQACLEDCKHKRRRSKRGERLLACADRHQVVLRKAECCMVNFDLHFGNIIAMRENGELHYAWIDPERSFWGDSLFDFISFEMFQPFAKKRDSIAAYNAAATKPVLNTNEERIRFAFSQAYMALVMETEKYYRYTHRNFGWWRNVGAELWLYKSAFAVLEKG